MAWLDELKSDLEKEPVNFKFIEVEPGNVARSRQLAFKWATSDRISFVDSDDRVIAGAFASLNEAMDATTAPVILSGEQQVTSTLSTISSPTFVGDFSFRQLVTQPSYGHSIRLYNRELLEQVIYKIRDGMVLQDWDILVRLTHMSRTKGLNDPAVIDQVTRLWRQRPGSANKTPNTREDWDYRISMFKDFYVKQPQNHEGVDIGASESEIMSRFRY